MSAPTSKRESPGPHLLTVSVEDYFHAGSMRGAVRPRHWERFESRVDRNVDQVLEQLARHDTRATFFVLGCIADKNPGLVRRLVETGHEVAASAYWPRDPSNMVPEDFREDVVRSKAALESAAGRPVFGHRLSSSWMRPEQLWILDVLIEQGFRYDSSINPVLRRFAGEPRRHELHRHAHSEGNGEIWEVPISTASFLGLRFAISGGNYVRQLPHTLLRRLTARWERRRDNPLVFYFVSWELDRQQPHVAALSRVQRIRHYRNLEKTRWVLEDYLRAKSFTPVAEHLELPWQQPATREVPQTVAWDALAEPTHAASTGPAVEATVVVPLYRERDNVAYLRRALTILRERMAGKARLRLVLVDDGSDDGTWEVMQREFADVPATRLYRHEQNRGVAAAIRTGIGHAETEIVCTLDCDCSYDPNELEQMLPRIEQADMVTASPYHPDGAVFHVPGWRLFLSRSLSRFYSLVLGRRIHTVTSCFRVLRRSVVTALPARHDGFLGVAEMLIELQAAGGTVLEHPTLLESRLFGSSKMKTLRVVRKHLGLLGALLKRRWTGRLHSTGEQDSNQSNHGAAGPTGPRGVKP